MAKSGTVLASTASTTTRTSTDVNLTDSTGVMIVVDFTNTPNNTETGTLSIEAKDPVTGKYMAFTAFTALTSSALGANPTTATFLYTLYPGGAETAATANHEVQALAAPQIFRVKFTHSGSTSWTYSVGYSGLK